jgi:hypothetical protein
MPARAIGDIRADWKGFIEHLPEGERFKSRLAELLLPRFEVAESLAEDYSRAGRAANFVFCLLAVAAVAIAVFAAASIGPSGSQREGLLAYEALLALLELIVIGAILAMMRTDEKRRWRERSLDYRALAEALRHLRFLAPIGECANYPMRRGAASGMGDWVFWYLRATIRELGLPRALLDATYQRELLRAAQSLEIDAGIDWHRHNRQRLDRWQLTLLHIAEACFLATAAILGIFLVLFLGWLGLHLATPVVQGDASAGVISWGDRLSRFLTASKPWMSLFAIVLPCAGAAIAGLRLVARFERTSDRAAKAEALLLGMKTEYAIARDHPELDKTAATLLDTARLEAELIDASRSLYGRKRLTLPV